MKIRFASNSVAIAVAVGLGLGAAGLAEAGKGPRASVSVLNVCSVDGRELTVDTVVVDASSQFGIATLNSSSITVEERVGRSWEASLTHDHPLTDNGDGTWTGTTVIDVCPLSDGAEGAVRAVVSLEVGNTETDEIRTYLSRCSDDPATPQNEARLAQPDCSL